MRSADGRQPAAEQPGGSKPRPEPCRPAPVAVSCSLGQLTRKDRSVPFRFKVPFPIAFLLLVYTGQPPSTRLFLKKGRTSPPLPVQSRSENALGHMATGGSRKCD